MEVTTRPNRKKLMITLTASALLVLTYSISGDEDAVSGDDNTLARTPWGDPDISGTYDIKTLTPVQRPRQLGDRQFITPEEAR